MILQILFFFAAAISSENCDADAGLFPAISKVDLKKAIEQKKVTVVDVNSDESYAEKHIPTAIHFKKSSFAKALPGDKKTLIVAYCGGPKCTAWKRAAEQACELGYTQVKHFKGGVRGWFKSEH